MQIGAVVNEVMGENWAEMWSAGETSRRAGERDLVTEQSISGQGRGGYAGNNRIEQGLNDNEALELTKQGCQSYPTLKSTTRQLYTRRTASICSHLESGHLSTQTSIEIPGNESRMCTFSWIPVRTDPEMGKDLVSVGGGVCKVGMVCIDRQVWTVC